VVPAVIIATPDSLTLPSTSTRKRDRKGIGNQVAMAFVVRRLLHIDLKLMALAMP